ncbi:uncharacterized protein DUF1702 [Scopulibacillus darangshiensis]|uniref:Uncharacterized protein DUF1702 n=1 Tax=Scopulibacillus darangshiensis TaxID=442528 RepID=A0A4R2NSM9_9BACL|nr:DUF1702 family protein [Scopulibacillus darangshiensis]TCP24474.1 uncharacterized protein DUF1702 [Scopulibacillus darangshiensis]
MGRIKSFILNVSLKNVDSDIRKFEIGSRHSKRRIENIGQAFLYGYNAALKQDELPFKKQMDIIEPELEGFAYEGAAMALTLNDFLFPTRSPRLIKFMSSCGANHIYMLHVGAGWGLARLPKFYTNILLSKMDPLLKWLSIDGYGFHEGYFHWNKAYPKMLLLSKVTNKYRDRAFAQGFGRSIWFKFGGKPETIKSIISNFPYEKQGDIWSGIGLALAYAGGVQKEEVETFKSIPPEFFPHLAQGVTFAAKARIFADIPSLHTKVACEVICETTVEKAAQITDLALKKINRKTPYAYENWRRMIREEFGSKGEKTWIG